jgi:membrane-bound inhibitor of C-type lysozyme
MRVCRLVRVCLCVTLAGCNTLWAGNPLRTKDIGVGISSVPPPPEVPDPGRVAYVCGDGMSLVVTFDNKDETVSVEAPGAASVTLAQRPSAAGFRYGDGVRELAGKGDEATWTVGKAAPKHCVAMG